MPAAKWPWFREALAAGQMLGIDPRSGVPKWWSLAPEDTLGLVFWTKDPTNLLADRELLRAYQTQVHVTLTGWTEVEKGAPDIKTGIRLLNETVEAFGAANVTWRFSPIPLLPAEEVLERYNRIATGVRQAEVFVSFLQENDLMPETRTPLERGTLLWEMAEVYPATKVLLCNEDQTTPDQINVGRGVCAPGFRGPLDVAKFEACGCILMADPFTINESCTLGCEYCYAADQSLSAKKRNTTRRSLAIVG